MTKNQRLPIYVPVLKWKAAEMAALAQLKDDVRSQVLPLVEIQPPSAKRNAYGDEQPPKPLGVHLQSVARELAKGWGLGAAVIVDARLFSIGPLDDLGGLTAQEYLFSCLERERVEAIPVITPESPMEALDSCAEIIQRDGRGACIRVASFHWSKERTEAEFASMVAGILDRLGIRSNQVDLVIDAGDVKAEWKAAEFAYVQTILKVLPWAKDWRSVALVSCGFPSSLAGLDNDGLHLLDRYDWALWRALLSGERPFARAPLFGDYGINHPSQGNSSSSVPLPTVAQIRYTSDDSWVCFKGELIGDMVRYHQLVKSGCGNRQFVALAKRLVKHPAFRGKDFSQGDGDIAAIANDHHSPEDPRGWRRIGTNHHITFVVKQLERLDDSSGMTGPMPGGLLG